MGDHAEQAVAVRRTTDREQNDVATELELVPLLSGGVQEHVP